MRFAPVSVTLALLSLLSPSASAQSSPNASAATSQPVCWVYAFVQEADSRHWIDMHSTPVVIPDEEIVRADYRKREALDFPEKITPWRVRLKRDHYNEYVVGWQEKNKSHWQGLSSQEKSFGFSAVIG
jgi:hypothetical protein